ncbi:hypothetical protein [Shewanella xiamenensis]|uniref:Uncharacterized protein n=1 Tax=Shewanella xiamenensis TaxID=332186 RepID=A0ABT6U8A4_9GAMM|nr:hypothetical protein [Shewanella xiamenensis]MDI5830687.1 hypothetical protein [Shewanella xiamenensis]
MTEEVDAIVKAINGLQQDGGYFKDYIFPIASAFFTSILGAVIAYITIKNQDIKASERLKLNSVNKWILLIEEARATLLAIKGNYHEGLSENPIERLSNVHEILFYANPITERYEALAFIAAKTKGTKLQKWGDIPRIRAMVNNYNYLLKLWDERNKLDRPIRQKIISTFSEGKAGATVNTDDIVECVGIADICMLINLTERVIKLTDDLIVEQNDFLVHFPRYAKTLIKIDKINDYGSVLNYSNNGNEKLLKLLEKSNKPSFESVEKIFEMKSDEIAKMHFTGYE